MQRTARRRSRRTLLTIVVIVLAIAAAVWAYQRVGGAIRDSYDGSLAPLVLVVSLLFPAA